MDFDKDYQDLNTIEKGLKLDYPKLTDFERLTLAIQKQRNQILIAGFVINSSRPSGLEAIANSLGYSKDIGSGNINERLSEITSALEDLKVEN